MSGPTWDDDRRSSRDRVIGSLRAAMGRGIGDFESLTLEPGPAAPPAAFFAESG